MACHIHRMPDGTAVFIKMSAPRARKCAFCTRGEAHTARHECDECDKPICDQHRTHYAGDRDYCPDHERQGRLF